MVTRVFDLVFYKVYSVYVKKEHSPVYTTVLFLGLMRISILLFILLFLQFTLGLSVNFDGYSPTNKKYIGAFLILLIDLPIIIYTYRRYSKKEKRDELAKKYSAEKYGKVKPLIFFMTPVVFFVMTIVMVFIFA